MPFDGRGRVGMRDRGGSDTGAALGALILAAATLLALLIVGLRLATGGRPEPTPTPLPAPTIAPTATAAPTLPPPTPTAVPTVAPTPPTAAFGSRRPIVCLDPGHGGEDLGNVRVVDGKIALQEKDFTLANALALAEKLKADGMDVVLTRTTDSEANPNNVDQNGDGEVASPDGPAKSDELDDLQARVNICNAANADILVSIHYNGAENVYLEGYEVWYNDERPFSDRSASLATLVHQELGAKFAAAGYEANDRGIGIEAHAVTGPARPGKLVPSNMPGVVVEGMFLSNDEDAAFLESGQASDVIVSAYEAAIKQYFEEYPV